MKIYPDAWVKYLVHFHTDRDYFECHEVMEEYWKEHPESPYRKTFVGLIQVAVALYHHRRGNLAGARKMMKSATKQLDSKHLNELGIVGEAFYEMIQIKSAQLLEEENPKYEDLTYPILDPDLLAQCKQASGSNFVWGDPDYKPEDAILHRHTRRDRSDVIAERESEKRRKAAQRGEAK